MVTLLKTSAHNVSTTSLGGYPNLNFPVLVRMFTLSPISSDDSLFDASLQIFFFRRMCDEEDNDYSIVPTYTEADLEGYIGKEVTCQILNNTVQDITVVQSSDADDGDQVY